MPASERQRPGKSAFVMAQKEGARVAAQLQAAVFQRAELERTGQRQRAAGDQPLVACQPWRAVDGRVDHRVADEREPPECGPHERVPGEEGREGRARAGLVRRSRGEQPKQWQGRRHHHRRDHRLPGEEEEHQGEPVRELALDQRVVVQRCAAPADLGSDRQRPRNRDRARRRRSNVPQSTPPASRAGSNARQAREPATTNPWSFLGPARTSRGSYTQLGEGTTTTSACLLHGLLPATPQRPRKLRHARRPHTVE